MSPLLAISSLRMVQCCTSIALPPSSADPGYPHPPRRAIAQAPSVRASMLGHLMGPTFLLWALLQLYCKSALRYSPRDTPSLSSQDRGLPDRQQNGPLFSTKTSPSYPHSTPPSSFHLLRYSLPSVAVPVSVCAKLSGRFSILMATKGVNYLPLASPLPHNTLPNSAPTG